jgi:hypothetical protein
VAAHCWQFVPCDAINVETSFSTEYSHAIRVVILHAKNILRGNAAPGTAMHRGASLCPTAVDRPRQQHDRVNFFRCVNSVS